MHTSGPKHQRPSNADAPNSTYEQPKSFEQEGGVLSSANPISILKSPPMYNTTSVFNIVKTDSMANKSNNTQISIYYGPKYQTAKENSVNFKIEKKR